MPKRREKSLDSDKIKARLKKTRKAEFLEGIKKKKTNDTNNYNYSETLQVYKIITKKKTTTKKNLTPFQRLMISD